MQMIYVAGPYTAPTRKQVKANIARAEAAGQRILAAGHIPIIPHKITSFWDEKGPCANWRHADWLACFCLPLMDRCDAVFFIEGWEHSDGATAEYKYAAATGMPIYFDLYELCLK